MSFGKPSNKIDSICKIYEFIFLWILLSVQSGVKGLLAKIKRKWTSGRDENTKRSLSFKWLIDFFFIHV